MEYRELDREAIGWRTSCWRGEWGVRDTSGCTCTTVEYVVAVLAC